MNKTAPAIRLVLQFEPKANRTTARPTKRIEHEKKFVRWPLFEPKTNRITELAGQRPDMNSYTTVQLFVQNVWVFEK